MTREEHIYQLKQYLQGKLISMCPASSLYWQEHWEEVIKALEQEPILDKIRAKISTVYESLDGYDPDSLGTFVSKIDEIFDRYKEETEET